MALDVAMGGSTNTVLHILAAAQEGEIDFDLAAIDAVSRRVPCLAKVAPNSRLPHGGRAPRRRHPRDPRRAVAGRAAATRTCTPCTPRRSRLAVDVGRPRRRALGDGRRAVPRRAGRRAHHRGLLHEQPLVARSTPTPPGGCIRDVAHAYTRDGGLAVLRGNIAPDGAIIKSAGHPRGAVALRGPGAGRREPGGGRLGDPRQAGPARRRAGGPLRGPVRRPGDAGDAAPDGVPQGRRAGQGLRADHRRPVLRRLVGHLGGPHLARGRGGRGDRPHRGRRPHRPRRPRAPDRAAGRRRRAGRAAGEDGGLASGRGSRATATAR